MNKHNSRSYYNANLAVFLMKTITVPQKMSVGPEVTGPMFIETGGMKFQTFPKRNRSRGYFTKYSENEITNKRIYCLK